MQEKRTQYHIRFIQSLITLLTTLLILALTGCTAGLPDEAITSADTAAIAAAKPEVMQTGNNALQSNDLEIHILDVGQGLSVFAQSGGQALLYDGGDRDYSSYVVSYLKEQGIETLDYIIASHYDADHLSGLVGAMNVFSAGIIIGPDYVHTSRVYESFVSRTLELGKEVEHPTVGTEYALGNTRITILSPKTIVSNSNNNSIAIKIQNGENTILIMGDAEYAEEADILSSGIDLDCTVLVLGHHGSASSTTWDLLQEAVPEYAVISCGRDNPYGHPHAETMEKLESMEIDMFRTDQQGTITVISNGHSLIWNQDPSTNYDSGTDSTTIKDEHYGNVDQTAGNVEESTSRTEPAYESAASESAPVPATESAADSAEVSQMVWKSATGSKYHAIPNCGNMNPDKASEITLDYAESIGLGRCKNCWR